MEQEEIEYSKPEKRINKNDLRQKRKMRPYKKGGRFRSIKLKENEIKNNPQT